MPLTRRKRSMDTVFINATVYNNYNFEEFLPCKEEIEKRYIQKEQEYLQNNNEFDNRIAENMQIYRKCGKLALTFGWFFDNFTEFEERPEEYDLAFSIAEQVLEEQKDQYSDFFSSSVKTIINYLSDFSISRKDVGKILKRIWKRSPVFCEKMIVSDDFSRLFSEENLSAGIYPMIKDWIVFWKDDPDRKNTIADILRKMAGVLFFAEPFEKPEMDDLLGKKTFLTEYIKMEPEWRRAVAEGLLLYLFGVFDDLFAPKDGSDLLRDEFIFGILKMTADMGENLLECFFQMALNSMRNCPGLLKRLTEIQDGKKSIRIEILDNYLREAPGLRIPFDLDYHYIKSENGDAYNIFLWAFTNLEIVIEDREKVHYSQLLAFYLVSEDMQMFFFRKGLFPKEMLPELINMVRTAGAREKMPLLLQWYYETEEGERYEEKV